MSLKDAIKKLADGIVDLSELEVTTYTGRLEAVVDGASGRIRWEDIRPGSGKVVLAAATLVRPNLDTVNFRATEVEGANLAALFELHVAAVESARNGRMALLKMFSGMLPPGAG